ncbi:MAG TPA: cytochrome ubiquinol oxidase subunit I [Nitrospira sp.]|nr:cytochrome ubiquinol oxidase subunit I [Nitrospira sp.]
MPFDLSLPAVQFPLIGNSIAVGIPSMLHIVLAGLSVAFLLWAPLFEWRGLSAAHFTALAYGVTKFTVLVFSVSTVLAVIMVELLIGLFPVTTMWIWNQFRAPIALASTAFLLQFAFLYPYYHYWEPIRRRSVRFHIILGLIAALLMLVWVAVLDGMGSYMLTPVSGETTWNNLWNPTWLSLALHRLIGEFVMAGYVIAAYGAWRLGRPDASERREYYLFLMKIGWIGGFGALLLQPLTGLIYASWIHQAAPDAYDQIVRGGYRLLAYLQFTLLALLMVGSYWLTKGTIPQDRLSGRLDVAIPGVAVLMIASVGHTAVRRALLYLLVVLILWALRPLFSNGGRRRLFTPPSLGPAMRPLALALGVLSILMYLTMGTIRETARRPYTVRNLISLQDEAEHSKASRASVKNRESVSLQTDTLE